VSNPLPASGAQGPEQLHDARRNTPLTLLAFERVVSLSDYQDFARAFPGIGKARADLAWVDGSSRVLLSVAGATGGAAGAEVMDNLRQAIADLSDPSQPFVLGASVLRYFRCTARVAIDPRHEADTVLAACRTKLQRAFGFDARDLAQSVTAAASDMQVVPAFGGRWDGAAKAMKPAELMLLNPAALELAEATP
jgi:hypothetical protein